MSSVGVRDKQFLGGKEGDHAVPVLRHDYLLFDARRRMAVLRRAIGLQGEDHALLDLHRPVEGYEAADDETLVQGEPEAVAELERERLHLAGKAELLRLRPA